MKQCPIARKGFKTPLPSAGTAGVTSSGPPGTTIVRRQVTLFRTSGPGGEQLFF